jgi:hypothetical protein
VIFAALPPNGASQLWLASCDRAFAPKMLASSGEDRPFFGPGNDAIFRKSEGGNNYIFKMEQDGSAHTKVLQRPIIDIKGMSPNRRWAIAMVPVNEVPSMAVVAIPVQGGGVRRICPAQCMAKWSVDGARFYVEAILQGTKGGMTVVLSVPKGKSLPDLPASGIRSVQDSAVLPRSKSIDLSSFDPSHMGQNVAPGLVAGTFAYAKTIVHQNLFQIPLP